MEPLLGAKRRVIKDVRKDSGFEQHNQPPLERVCGTDCWLSDERSRAADSHTRSADTKKLSIAVALCLIFAAMEVAGGLISNSLAILTDAAHLLSDVAGFAISLFSIWATSWEATPRQTYGYFRLEILGTLLSIQLIWLLTGILVYEAIYRMTHASKAVDGRLMFIVAGFGFCVNIIMVFLLGHHGHGHDHGHEHCHAHGHQHRGNQSPGHTHVLVNKNLKHDHTPEGSMHKDKCIGHAHDHEHGGSQSPGCMPVLVSEKLKHDHTSNTSMHEHNDNVDDHGQYPHNHSHGEGEHHHESHNLWHFGGDKLKLDFNGPVREDSIKVDMAVDGCSGMKARGGSINVRGAWLHVFGDLIQSIGVMIGGAVIWVKPTWKVVDLICTLLFSVLVLGTTVKILREIVEVLMESTPREIDVHELEKGLCEVPGVIAIHDLHIWAITLGKTLLACHVTIYSDADADAILQHILGYCETRFNISHVTVQIERHHGAVLDHC